MLPWLLLLEMLPPFRFLLLLLLLEMMPPFRLLLLLLLLLLNKLSLRLKSRKLL